ncbi:MAG: PKD-like family lipoprotein [Prevotellaceae bacterium]|nr:PKD-like family lipoprotein [Prevotellaceae bacterium]
MNRYSTIFMLSMAVLGTSCVNDDSNEQLTALNEAAITGIADTYDNVYVDDQLTIRPTIVSSIGNEGAFSYFWIAYDKQTYYSADTLARTKDLDVKVSLKPGEHTLKFKAVDSATGIFYEKESTVNVVNNFSAGLLLLCDNNGEAELGFWSPANDRVTTDLYGKLNENEKLGKNPQRVYFNKYTNDEASEVVVLCQDGEGGKVLNSISMTKAREYKDFFLALPETIFPEAYYRCSMREYVIDDGLVYDRATNSYTPVTTVKPNMISQGRTYRVSPNCNLGDDAAYPTRMAFFDDENGCFYMLQNISTAFLTTARKTNGVTYVPGGFFDPDNTGMVCIYANINSRSSSGAREYLGVFKTKAGEYRLLKFGIGFWVSGATPATYFKDLGNDAIEEPSLVTASSYTCSASFTGYLFYSNGNSVYVYNTDNHTSKKIYELGATCSINRIELENNGNQLWIAYTDNAKTTAKAGFAVLAIGTDGGINTSLVTKHDAIAEKIVDFEQKF